MMNVKLSKAVDQLTTKAESNEAAINKAQPMIQKLQDLPKDFLIWAILSGVAVIT